MNQNEIVSREEACHWTQDSSGKGEFYDFPSDQVELHNLPRSLVLSELSWIFLLTAVVAVDKLIAITLGLANLVALLAIIEAGIILILMVSRWWWRRFRWARDGKVASRAYTTTSDRSARSVMIVRCTVLSVLWSVLVFLWSAVSRIVIFGWKDIVRAAAASLGWYSRVATVLTRLWEKSIAIPAVIILGMYCLYYIFLSFSLFFIFFLYISFLYIFLFCIFMYILLLDVFFK